MGFMDQWADGWTFYIWFISGAGIVIAAMVALRWAYQNDQFDEDIKYVIFTEGDQDRMTPEEYKKSRKVLEEQIALRNQRLEEQAELDAQKEHHS